MKKNRYSTDDIANRKVEMFLRTAFGRSWDLVEALRKEALADPQRRVGWWRFDEVGEALGLTEEVIDSTRDHSFDVFELEFVSASTGREMPIDKVRAALRNPGGALRNDLLFYFKVKT